MSRAGATISICALVAGTTVVLFIAPVLASRKPIDGVWKRHGKRCQALPPTQPSHALFRILKTLRDFRRKTTMLDRHFHCLRATSIPIGNHPGNRTGHRPARTISRYPTFSNASRRPFLSHPRAFWSQPNDSASPAAHDFSVARPRPLRRLPAQCWAAGLHRLRCRWSAARLVRGKQAAIKAINSTGD